MGTIASGISRRAALRGMGGVAGAAAGIAVRAGLAQEATPAVGGGPLAVEQVSLAQARALVDAAVAESEARGLRMVVAVVDTGANLVALVRMDGAWLASVDVAIKQGPHLRPHPDPHRRPRAAGPARRLPLWGGDHQRGANHLPRRVAAGRHRRGAHRGDRRLRLHRRGRLGRGRGGGRGARRGVTVRAAQEAVKRARALGDGAPGAVLPSPGSRRPRRGPAHGTVGLTGAGRPARGARSPAGSRRRRSGPARPPL